MNDNFLRQLFSDNSMRIAGIGTLAILALFLLAQTIAVAQGFGRSGVPATDTITVQGTGEATLPPDIATISFTVQNSADTVADAQKETIEQTNGALSFVREKGVAEKDIKTLSYNINPRYSYPNPCLPGALCPEYSREPKITGYQVSQSIQVKVRDLKMVGEFLAGLGERGVQNVNGPSFGLDDSTAGYDAARADAISEAKKQARTLAKQLGVNLGKIVSFSESSGGYPYPVYAAGFGGAMESKAAPVPDIPSGENTYSASVSITYEIR